MGEVSINHSKRQITTLLYKTHSKHIANNYVYSTSPRRTYRRPHHPPGTAFAIAAVAIVLAAGILVVIAVDKRAQHAVGLRPLVVILRGIRQVAQRGIVTIRAATAKPRGSALDVLDLFLRQPVRLALMSGGGRRRRRRRRVGLGRQGGQRQFGLLASLLETGPTADGFGLAVFWRGSPLQVALQVAGQRRFIVGIVQCRRLLLLCMCLLVTAQSSSRKRDFEFIGMGCSSHCACGTAGTGLAEHADYQQSFADSVHGAVLCCVV